MQELKYKARIFTKTVESITGVPYNYVIVKLPTKLMQDANLTEEHKLASCIDGSTIRIKHDDELGNSSKARSVSINESKLPYPLILGVSEEVIIYLDDDVLVIHIPESMMPLPRGFGILTSGFSKLKGVA